MAESDSTRRQRASVKRWLNDDSPDRLSRACYDQNLVTNLDAGNVPNSNPCVVKAGRWRSG
jgi:hypothetical protein